ncbi:hypothetical protein FAIPA1_20274 [Frankia sp. AiPs1]
MATTPGPVGRPEETVTPEVSECSRTPARRRPLSTAISACPPSCAMVITCRATGHTWSLSTVTAASTAARISTQLGGSGCASRLRRRMSIWPAPSDSHNEMMFAGSSFLGTTCDEARSGPTPLRPIDPDLAIIAGGSTGVCRGPCRRRRGHRLEGGDTHASRPDPDQTRR